MYLVGVCDIDDCYTCFYIQVYKKSKVSAAQERQRLIRNAYHGETVLCYDKEERNGYKELLPPVKVKKKTDARMGEDIELQFMFGGQNRKKYLKYKYLGKVLPDPSPVNPEYSN